jgi:hypothetical protein
VFVTYPASSTVWVVDGDGPAALAEHIAGMPEAVAADATSLYVATLSAVYRFYRATGSEVSKWALPPLTPESSSDALRVSLTLADGTLWVTLSQGAGVDVYRVDPKSASPPALVVRGAVGALVGPDGSLYYERQDAHLVRVGPNGKVTVGPALVDHPNGLGGGVQYLDSVAAGQVWASEPAGQGLDSSYAAFDATTLKAGASFFSTVGASMADTLAGPLYLSGPEFRTCTAECVLRLASDGKLTDAVGVGGAQQLLGPYPVVLGYNATGTELEVERLS